jgi:hypothetical protein
MDADRFATRGLTRPDPHGGPDLGPGNATLNTTLRAEALRQLRWLQREWTRILATKDPGLIAVAARAGFTDGLDVLREAGEDVPSWLYRRGSPVPITHVMRGATAHWPGLTLSRAPLTRPARLSVPSQAQLATEDHALGDHRHRPRSTRPPVSESHQELARRNVRAAAAELKVSVKAVAA